SERTAASTIGRVVTRAHSAKGRSRPLSVRRVLPWLSGLILAAGIIFAIVVFWPSHHATIRPTSRPAAEPPAASPAKPKSRPLSKAATAVARTFLPTAVPRLDLNKVRANPG